MPTGQNSPATLLANGKVLVAGGDTAELYDPSTRQWTSTPALYYGASTGISATLLTNGDVLIYGNKFSCYAAQFFNPSVGSWTRTIGQCGNSISHGRSPAWQWKSTARGRRDYLAANLSHRQQPALRPGHQHLVRHRKSSAVCRPLGNAALERPSARRR
jgi:hypothetical protein